MFSISAYLPWETYKSTSSQPQAMGSLEGIVSVSHYCIKKIEVDKEKYFFTVNISIDNLCIQPMVCQ